MNTLFEMQCQQARTVALQMRRGGMPEMYVNDVIVSQWGEDVAKYVAETSVGETVES